MIKSLVNSDTEFMALFSELSLSEIENLINIEFALEDGVFPDDWIKGVEINEELDLDPSNYRKFEDSIFPEEYPCLVVHLIDTDFDWYGKYEIRILDFIYPKDFESKI